MTPFRRFLGLSPIERLLTLEAVAVLTVAAACVALLPFRVLAKSAARPPRGEIATIAGAQTVTMVRNAIMRSARRMPFRAKCFEQGLAAVWMLRRRGVATTLHYGMAMREDKLVAHVWVTVADRGVVGCENSHEFRELVRFPAG
jgi:hypothetical protein